MSLTDVQIRKARVGDEPGIHKAHMRSINEICIHDHGEEEVQGWGNRTLGDRWKAAVAEKRVWVLESRAEIKGVACILIRADRRPVEAHIQALYLTPEVYKRGFGRRLMEIMLEYADAYHAEKITTDSTLTAHDFYKRFGFVDTSELKKEVIAGSKVSSYDMELTIKFPT